MVSPLTALLQKFPVKICQGNYLLDIYCTYQTRVILLKMHIHILIAVHIQNTFLFYITDIETQWIFVTFWLLQFFSTP